MALRGNDGDNDFLCTRFDDEVFGFGGDDTITGSPGEDTIDGGDDIDFVQYAAFVTFPSNLHPGDAINVDLEQSVQHGGFAEGDVLLNIENVGGTWRDDVIKGNGVDNILEGNEGNDTIEGRGGDDTIHGDIISFGFPGFNIGDDHLDGGAGDDTLFGDGGDDVLIGGLDDDQLFGGDGNDTLFGGQGLDHLDGGAGTDMANYSGSASAVGVFLNAGIGTGSGDAGGDVLVSIENVIGSNFNDSLFGSSVANLLAGGFGNDSLAGLGGADTLNGGNGNDTASYAASAAGVTVNLATGAASGGDATGDTLISIENLTGSNFLDVLTGNNLANGLSGGGGNDQLTGGLGNDTLAGGSGADAFLFNTALNGATNVDIITDFNVAEVDTILIDDAIFTGLAGTVGNSIALQEFRIGAAAQDADDRIIYNDVTGALLFDVDGTGGVAAVQFATLSPGLALTNGLIGII